MLMHSESDIKESPLKDSDEKLEMKNQRNKTGSLGSDAFLYDCQYSLDLNELYTLSGKSATCSYNECMEYAPVLIKISDKIKRLHSNHNYLLQCWDHFGTKVFQLKLQKPIKQWAICFDYFIFKTQAPDADSDYFQIMNLRNHSRTLVIDFLKDDSYVYFAYNNGKLFAANHTTIKVCPVKLVAKKSASVKREINEHNVASI